MFVRLGSRLHKIEFASCVGAILVQCIKCEGFFFLPLYLRDNLRALLDQ